MNAIARRLAAATSAAVFLLSPALARAQIEGPAAPAVLVVGGTPAGVAAAIGAARLGQHVDLVSANGDLGGTLTGAMMDQWDLNLAPNGTDLDRGIFQEMYARLGDAFTPALAERELRAMVAEEPNIDVRYDAIPTSVQTVPQADGLRRVDAVSFRDARDDASTTISASYVIDATDSADVAVLAGARYDVGRQDSGIDEREQAVTEMFTVDDVSWSALANSYDAARYGAGGVTGRRAWGYSDLVRGYKPAFDDVVVRDLNLGLQPDGDVTVNAIDVTGIDGTEPKQLENAKVQTEIEAPRLLAYLRTRLPGFEDARVGMFASDVYVRETRHIAGIERLTTRDVWTGRIPVDSIGLASYPIDLHPVDPTDEPAFAPERHVYGIPFGTLVPKGLANVLLAGAAISASHLASGSARVIPTTIEEGEADGVAVAVAARHDWDFSSIARSTAFFTDVRHDLAERAGRPLANAA